MRNGRMGVGAVLALTLLAGASPGDCGGAAPVAGAGEGLLERSGGQGMASRFATSLHGFQEVPAISTTGSGTFQADLAADGQSLTWTLTYADLEGNAAGTVTGAHVHLGQRGVAGGVAVHLCGGGGGTGPCPAPPATLTGTFGPDGVVGPAGQGLDAGELPQLLQAMRSGNTYVNVHTTRFASGEIRGQLRGHRGGDHDDD